MKILSVVTRNYYGQPHAIEPMFLEFTQPLQAMGHFVETFDHVLTFRKFGLDACGRLLADKVRQSGYDAIFYQTGGQDFVARDAIKDVARYAPIIAWNSDDDWQWDSYTSSIAPLFTWMITTYPHIYEAARLAHPNLLLSQWGCLDSFAAAADRGRDIDFSFVGQVYRNRVAELRALRRRAGLAVHGLGALRVSHPIFEYRPLRQAVARLVPATNRALAFAEVHDIWNRTRISYTPLGASKDPKMLQIKGRVFQMGLSGTLMLCNATPHLEAYYTAGKEYVPFHDLDDCIEKVNFYLRREPERQRIAANYAARTRAEHMWRHRFEQIFRQTLRRSRSGPSTRAA